MTKSVNGQDKLLDGALGWIGDLEGALSSQDSALFDELFIEDSYWRDMVALTWDTQQFWGRESSRTNLFKHSREMAPRNFHLQPNRSGPRLITEPSPRVEMYAAFETEVGTGSAFIVLIPDRTAKWGMRARQIATAITGLHCNPPAPITRRGFEPAHPGETWLEYRNRVRDLTDRDPDVLIVGVGQSGLSIAAHLDRLGVSYLAVDKNAKPGDSWRKRYNALALHTPTWANNLPFTAMPPTYPAFMSKDQWANWIDAYAATMDLNVWTETEFAGGDFDSDAMRWNVRLLRADGTIREMRPRHVIMALGFTGIEPVIPELPGLDTFAGEVVHTSAFTAAEPYRGKSVLVIGTATSGHDIALDLHNHGADVVLGQRGPACVVPVLEAERYNEEYLESGMSCEEIDQRRNSNFVYPLIVEKLRMETDRTEAEYAELYDGLRAAGMTLTIGEDRTGWLMRLHRTFSGYYLDVGASQVIVDGGIKVLQLTELAGFDTHSIQLADGSTQHLDAVVLATGYKNMQAVVEKLLGSDVADRVGLIGGIGTDGEPRNMCRPTGQPHLWMVYGGIMDARKTSEFLALQIVANLEGIVPSFVRGADGRIEAVSRHRRLGSSGRRGRLAGACLMLAALYDGATDGLTVAEVELIHDSLGPRDVRVKVGATGVCHSDLSALHGTFGPLHNPTVMGHEGAGTVLEVGPAVTRVRVGDRVITSLIPACGECFFCVHDQSNLCELTMILRGQGTGRYTGSGGTARAFANLGTFAEEIIVHEASVIAVNSDLPDEQLALIGCGVTTGVCAALNTAAVKPGSTVAVFGCGGVGVAAIQGAAIAGASRIIAVDPIDFKRRSAKQFGATDAIDPTVGDVVDQIQSLTGGRGVDYAFEVVGQPTTVLQATAATRLGGTTVLIGAGKPGDVVTFDLFALHREKRLLGCGFGSAQVRRDFPRLVALAQSGRLNLAAMVSRTLPIADVNTAFDLMTGGEVIRSVLTPSKPTSQR